MNGYNFTERVRKVLAKAREEAARLHHEYVGTEHILLGLIREGEGVGATVLQNLSVELDDLQQQIEEVVKKGKAGQTTGPDLPYTSRAKKILELAMSEARQLNHAYVGTEHLLMGLIREEKGIAAQMIKSAGVDEDNARAEILRVLGTEVPGAARPDSQRHKPSVYDGTAGLPQYAERLRSVIAAAHDVAARQKSNEITSIHAAIALLEHGQGMANAALDSFDFSRSDALAALNQLVPTGTSIVGPEDVVTMSGELSNVLQTLDARAHARRFAPPGTHHLLLSILHMSPDVAAVFARQSINEDTVRERIVRLSG